jgi:hypothetical protein
LMRLHETILSTPSLRDREIDIGFIWAFADLGSMELALSVWEDAVAEATESQGTLQPATFRAVRCSTPVSSST